jgi:hypothetical protein
MRLTRNTLILFTLFVVSLISGCYPYWYTCEKDGYADSWYRENNNHCSTFCSAPGLCAKTKQEADQLLLQYKKAEKAAWEKEESEQIGIAKKKCVEQFGFKDNSAELSSCTLSLYEKWLDGKRLRDTESKTEKASKQ